MPIALWIVLAAAVYFNLGLLFGKFNLKIWKKPDSGWWSSLKIFLWPLSFFSDDRSEVFINWRVSEKDYLVGAAFFWPVKILWLSVIWGIFAVLYIITNVILIVRIPVVFFLKMTTWPIRGIAKINAIGQLRPVVFYLSLSEWQSN